MTIEVSNESEKYTLEPGREIYGKVGEMFAGAISLAEGQGFELTMHSRFLGVFALSTTNHIVKGDVVVFDSGQTLKAK